MDLTSIPIMTALKKHMNWLNSNQTVISQNIANADTPGYRSKELEKQDFSKLVGELSAGNTAPTVAMRTNSARHMGTDGGAVGAESRSKEVSKGEETLTGNSVILEDETIKLADTQMKYGMVVNLYKKNIGLLKAAMGKGAGGR